METEHAWAAGFFDGEGNIHVGVHRHRWKRIVLTIAQTERTTLERFQAAVGAGYISGPYGSNPRWTKAYYWKIEGAQNCADVIEKLWPYLSGPKRQQIERATDQWVAYQASLALRRQEHAG